MNIAIILTTFGEAETRKCSGVIAGALTEVGHNITVYTKKRVEELRQLDLPYQVADLSQLDPAAPGIDAFLVYTWLSGSGQLFNIMRKARSSGKTVVVKGDSDGRLAYPLLKRKEYLWALSNANTPLRFAKVALGLPWKRVIHRMVAIRDIERNLMLATSVLLETPGAEKNIRELLSISGGIQLASKIRVIPNPVHPDFIKYHLLKKKEKAIITVGRWEDHYAKNPRLMIRSSLKFLVRRSDYHLYIVGSPIRLVEDAIAEYGRDVTNRVHLLGVIPNDQLPALYAAMQIYFLSSNFEGFNTAVAEALTMGCTFVAPPLDCAMYFADNGKYGTISDGWKVGQMVKALDFETNRWENGLIHPNQNSTYWKEMLDPKRIAGEINKLFHQEEGR